MNNDEYEKFFPLIITASTDERNFVKKAVSWALRNIGKRNLELNQHALVIAHQIMQIDSNTAHWIANDVIRKLSSDKIQVRMSLKKCPPVA